MMNKHISTFIYVAKRFSSIHQVHQVFFFEIALIGKRMKALTNDPKYRIQDEQTDQPLMFLVRVLFEC